MATTTASQISDYPDYTSQVYCGPGTQPRTRVQKSVAVTGLTAGDVIPAVALGYATITAAFDGTYATAPVLTVSMSVDLINNQIIVGTGPSNQTVYFVVEGTQVSVTFD